MYEYLRVYHTYEYHTYEYLRVYVSTQRFSLVPASLVPEMIEF